MNSVLFRTVSISTAALIGTGGSLLYARHNVNASEEKAVKNHEQSLERKSRVAVIGAGIGGASTCYFLRKLLGDTIDIDVYEKSDRVGGRLSVLDVNGQDVECGGTYILKGHKYMVQLAEETDSETNDVLNDAIMRVWDGESLINLPSSMWWVDLVKMAWRYGPVNLWRFDNTTGHVENCFKKIYKLQDEGVSFETVREMLTALDEKQKLMSLTQMSFKQAMQDRGISQKVTDELINPIIRWNLGQDADNINGLVGFLIAGGGKDGPVWNFKDGNYNVCKKLFQLCKAEVRYYSHVKKIERFTLNPSSEVSGEHPRVEYRLKGENMDCQKTYDVVIVATPLEIPSTYVSCQSCKDWPKAVDLGQYQKRLTNFVESELKAESFNVSTDSKEIPDVILTTKDARNQYDTIVRLYQTNGEKTAPAVHKVFSRDALTKEQMSHMFGEDSIKKEFKVVSWLACPRYEAKERFIPFRLDEGVFHVNAMERVKVGMEYSAIGGRNVALLVSKYLKESS